MVKKLFICPPDFGTDENCRTLIIPNTQQWLGIFNAAILTLANVYNYEQLYETDLTPEECAAKAMEIYSAYLLTNSCAPNVATPFWDDETDNEVELPEDEQTWFGAVTDWLAPAPELNFVQNIALWAITGFVAYAATPAAAIFFRTTAKRFIVAVETTDIPELIRVVVGAATYTEKTIDTTDFPNQIIEIEFVSDEDETDIYIIQGEI